ncbi:hypothetical protein LOK49_LG01G04139 [Camellia lanceoleosa]|uniref:Uncharacterized protein n=1 Tax=Camellia lanceoleosa TaxID=1840588 RepID=A0ACC0IXF9_9ERIC|nr:hypothetical protein LOK49_LG01G04139 [Camellia lanceoleosa]
MATGRLYLAPIASVCVIFFAVLVLAGLSEGAHSPTMAPAPSPHSGGGGGGGSSPSAAGAFAPHLFVSTLLASLAFIVPSCAALFY